MKSKFAAEPSVVTELTEFSLTVVLLLAIGLFLGSFALHQADLVLTHGLVHLEAVAA